MKRPPGTAGSDPRPDAPGPVTLDAAARTLTVAAGPPAHATSLAAFREPAGGTPVPAGAARGNVVHLNEYTPLEPGVVYTAWVQGKNSRGLGPKGNVVTFTA